MLIVTCKVNRPAVGHGVPDCPIRKPESDEEMLELADGSDENVRELFFKAYRIEMQGEFRPDVKPDGSSDDDIRERGLDYIWTGAKKGGGGFSRAHAQDQVIKEYAKTGKTSFSMEELAADVEAKLEEKREEREAENGDD